MTKLFFDIETIPAGEESLPALKYLYDKRVAKKEGEDVESFEEYVARTGFDGTFGRICCIAYAINDERVVSISGDERELLKKFWEVASLADLIVGHNIRDFDLPFLMQRSAILGVKPTWNKFEEPGKKPWDMVKFLSFARYKNAPIFDTMHEWNNWGDGRNNKGLEYIALAMGIPTPKDAIDGSQVAEYFKAGKIKEICEYCAKDVEATRQVYKRMTFEGAKPTETLPF